MKGTPIVLALLMSGCASQVAQTQPLPMPTPPFPPVAAAGVSKPVAKSSPIVTDPVAAVSVLPPAQLPHAATKSLDDATDYVVWRLAKPENIDKLTPLTERVSRSIARMKAGEVNGHYQDEDVLAARAALLDLRVFLRTKGD
jgi:hypothetical protein